mmetsp:Transcript_27326/g.41303  ORF Transcript_27326/g.41303 Transcript_27326/m.41303 type:complete len:220 (-) Transcript_27326:37-696(-)
MTRSSFVCFRCNANFQFASWRLDVKSPSVHFLNPFLRLEAFDSVAIDVAPISKHAPERVQKFLDLPPEATFRLDANMFGEEDETSRFQEPSDLNKELSLIWHLAKDIPEDNTVELIVPLHFLDEITADLHFETCIRIASAGRCSLQLFSHGWIGFEHHSSPDSSFFTLACLQIVGQIIATTTANIQDIAMKVLQEFPANLLETAIHGSAGNRDKNACPL